MIGRVCWAAALLMVASFHLSEGWTGWQALLTMMLAAVAPVVLVALAVRLKMRIGIAVGVLAGVVALGTSLAAISTGTGLVTALRDSVPRLLTAPRPAPATIDLMLPGALLAAIVGLIVAARVARDGRALVAPPAGASVLYVATALLTNGQADRYGLAAAGLLLLTAAGWLFLDRPNGRHIAPASAVVVTVGSACVGLFAAVLPMSDAFEPRELVRPPSHRLSEPSPLPRLAAWALQGDVELMRVRGEPRPIRLVALAEYTGSSWRVSGLYRPLGADEQASLPAGQRRTRVTANVHVSGLDGPWLPTVGDPVHVSLPNVDVDPDSGSSVVPGGLRAGTRYEISGDLDDARPDDITAAGVPDTPVTAPYLSTPNLPWQLAEYARQATHNANTPYEQAVAIEHAVRSGRKFDAGAPTGTSYARLTTFLLGPPEEAGAQAGTAEQFSAAFAVLARAARLPTRIVVGFAPGERAEDGTLIVRGRHATAWPEVYFAGWGWHAFNPTPSGDGSTPTVDAARQEVLARLAERATSAIVPASPRSTPPAPSHQQAAPPATTGTPAASRLGQTIALLIGLLVLPLVVVAGARTVRRARHRRRGPQGAWAEVLDLLVLLGRPAVGSQAAPDIAAGLAALLPLPRHGDPHPAARLACAADQAAFGPNPPTPRPEAWTDLRVLRRAARRVVPWHRRLLWPVDPRPLRRR
ncbi:transglutaminase domain-containing protein [Kibdelosporangium persicum]|uniref:Transglutaminase domain-containing protein n=1 Tax=Kibdelosporangium persicum TaxID=2698649 RepID=A0ABX2FCV7_9PSEU|nr:transglutaminase domain-containing protein [Kibdelosporangium persicum]NRN68750.1 Transglutaminase domain-containing protein [Kibdelosporangium persicum]